MTTSRPWPYLALMIGCMAASQIMLKQAGLYAAAHLGWIHTIVFNPWLWLGLVASTAGFAAWFLTLRRMPLASAYPWTALIYLLTPLAGIVLFHETLSLGFWLGIALIVVGLFITNGSARTDECL
ncbi:EamA family transporter [Xanthomonas sp. AmX2]|uniref:DMT family transporter n=1 Tax=Xanthomonas sp. TaxID=29446 RepID=UPI00197D7FEC|nr:EamA family transporter [Xanthomonas sp.]MBN6150363.1 EamA family transporter [Xanthomonas sp.]